MEITTRMYEFMFSEYPDIKQMFMNTKNGQAERLASAVLAYAQNIDNLAALSASIEAIAKKHVSANVQAEHYPIVGNMLLSAMKDVLGDIANEEVIAAWSEAYFFLADIFIKKEQELYNQ